MSRPGISSPYCVCNTTYCDDLEPIVKQSKGTILLYQTSQAGDRLKQSELNFGGSCTEGLTLTVHPSMTYQKIIGFGGCFTDASGVNLNALPEELAQNVMNDYFSESGIEYNMARVPIAGVDFSTHPYSYDDHQDDFNLTNFKLTDEDHKLKVDYNKTTELNRT